MWQTPDWLRRAGKHLTTGLIAVGQCLGAYTPAECYGFGPATAPASDTADGNRAGGDSASRDRADGGTAARRTGLTTPGDGMPPPGHPERLVPVATLSRPERAAWRRLEDLWERDAYTADGVTDTGEHCGH
ncbi:DUF6059 family protein [Streptomyces sp. NPDC048639]|uniref:DUF6059 family protein n=1 Tax=Streptomyces sp. NPDC048639 TaxID=3365581 RepID=UPI0037234D05